MGFGLSSLDKYMGSSSITSKEVLDDEHINTFTVGDHKLYEILPKRMPLIVDSIILVICGGAFVISEPDVKAMTKISKLAKIYTLTYPTIVNSTLPDVILHLEAIVQLIIDRNKNLPIILIGNSAGAFLGAQIIQRSKFKSIIVKFIGINGYYGFEYTDNVLLKHLDKYFVRKKSKIYKLNHLSTDTLLIACNTDFLKHCTTIFSKSINVKPIILYGGSHSIFWNFKEAARINLYNIITRFCLDLSIHVNY